MGLSPKAFCIKSLNKQYFYSLSDRIYTRLQDLNKVMLISSGVTDSGKKFG